MHNFRILVSIFLFISYFTVAAEVKKTVSANYPGLKFISYNLKPKELLTLYKDAERFSIDYEKENLYFSVEKSDDKKTSYKMKLFKENQIYNLKWTKKNNKTIEFAIFVELKPSYYSFGLASKCDHFSLHQIQKISAEVRATYTSEVSKLNFDSSCDSKLGNIFGTSYRSTISNHIFGVPHWKDPLFMNDSSIYRSEENVKSEKNILARAQSGLTQIENDGSNNLIISCENSSDCSHLGSYSPGAGVNKITLYPNCVSENNPDEKCKLKSALNEELLHHVTKVGNETDDHNYVKLIAKNMTLCLNNISRSIEFASNENEKRADFNETITPNLKAEQLPQPPPLPNNITRPIFATNPATDVARTTTGPAVDREFFAVQSNLQPTIAWAAKVMDAVQLTGSRAIASTKSSTHQVRTPIISKNSSPTAIAANSTPPKSNNPKESPTEEPTQLAKAVNAPNEAASNITRSNQETPNGRSQTNQTEALQAQQRTVASAQPNNAIPNATRVINASTTSTFLPQEISNAVQISRLNIRTVQDLTTGLKDRELRPSIVKVLENKNIQILGLGDQPIGEQNTNKARIIYRYSGSPPRLIKVNVKQNSPINI
ncbi:MAG: hypothetical protein AABY64_01675 [Bdellovibrionota bacterium]